MSNQTVIRRAEGGRGGQREEENKGMCWFHYEFCNLSPGSNTGAKQGRHKQRERERLGKRELWVPETNGSIPYLLIQAGQ